MSSRFAFEQLASLRRDAQRLLEQSGDQEDHALALLAVEDVRAASRSPARLHRYGVPELTRTQELPAMDLKDVSPTMHPL